MSKKKKILIGLGILSVIAAVIIVNLVSKGRDAVTVQTGEVKRKDLTSTVSASGQIEPRKSVDISADIPGKVMKLAVEEGDQVEENQFLLEIDPIPYRARLSSAKANAALANANLKQSELVYHRKQDMRDKNSNLLSDEEFERFETDYMVRKAQYEAAVAEVTRSRADLDKSYVTSPIAGVVTRLNVEEGEVAVIGTMNQPGTVLLTIADLSIMEAEIEVDETDVISLALDQVAEVSVDAIPDTSFTGRVTEIGNSPIVKGIGTSQEATDFKVVVTLDNPPASLRPGLTATADITTATREQAIAVPIQALVIREVSKEKEEDDGFTDVPKRLEAKETEEDSDETDDDEKPEKEEKEGVFVVLDEKVEFRPILTGITGELDIEVLSGLEGDEVIVTGSYRILRELKDGDDVKKEKKKEKKDKDES